MKTLSIFFFSLFSSILWAQDSILIAQPKFPSPEERFYDLFVIDKFSNPVHLNGKVKAVSKITRSFAKDTTRAISNESFKYQLNSNGEVTKYVSNVEFDEMTPEKLNLEKRFFITVEQDTTINHDELVYTIRNNKISAIEGKQNIYGDFNEFVDSTAYIYEKDNLVKIEYFEKEILENEYEEILISDYQLIGVEKVVYYSEGFLQSKCSVWLRESEVFKSETIYHFNRKSQLHRYAVSWMTFDANNFDENLECLNVENPVNPMSTKNVEGSYLFNHITGFVSEFESSQEDVTIKYLVTIKDKETFISSYINYELIATDSIMYDEYRNPIELKHYKIIDGKNLLESNTKLKITYFE